MKLRFTHGIRNLSSQLFIGIKSHLCKLQFAFRLLDGDGNELWILSPKLFAPFFVELNSQSEFFDKN